MALNALDCVPSMKYRPGCPGLDAALFKLEADCGVGPFGTLSSLEFLPGLRHKAPDVLSTTVLAVLLPAIGLCASHKKQDPSENQSLKFSLDVTRRSGSYPKPYLHNIFMVAIVIQ